MTTQDGKLWFNNNNSYFWQVNLERVLDITPFLDQRKVDTKRVKIIAKEYEKHLKLNEYKSFDMSSPLIMVRSEDRSDLILDRNNDRQYACIVDGQHRLEAFKRLQKKHDRIKYINIPIIVHLVKTMEEAIQIQFDLFEQKPFSGKDKIKRNEYNIDEVFEFFINQLRKNYNRYIKDRVMYSDKSGARRTNLLTKELENEINNSPNIKLWFKRYVKHDELLEAYTQLMKYNLDEYNELKTIKNKKMFFGLKTMPKKLIVNEFTVITYKYHKNYKQLVNDLEEYMGIIDEYEPEEDEFSEEDTKPEVSEETISQTSESTNSIENEVTNKDLDEDSGFESVCTDSDSD